jgi:hypothetical protein
MVSIPYVKTLESVFLAYGTPIRTSNSTPIAPELLNQGITEDYVMDRKMNRWDGPAFSSYATIAAHLRTYVNWPHTNSKIKPTALGEAGIFHTGNTHFLYTGCAKIGFTVLGFSYYYLKVLLFSTHR